jgi:hypothetical protein
VGVAAGRGELLLDEILATDVAYTTPTRKRGSSAPSATQAPSALAYGR